MIAHKCTSLLLAEILWSKVKLFRVDQVIMGAMGVYVRIFPSYFLSDFLYSIAIAGLAISSVGALAGGFGFFAGNAPAFPSCFVLFTVLYKALP